jgi:hypothetical protein
MVIEDSVTLLDTSLDDAGDISFNLLGFWGQAGEDGQHSETHNRSF